jgi:hypothetical protein
MSRDRKYTGGSKVVSFRLPVIGYNEAITRVNELLNTIAMEGNKTELNNTIVYQCGCTLHGGKHTKAIGCRMA